jgi:hypothetical protein
MSRCHGRLGYSSYVIVRRVLASNNLEFSKESTSGVYNACQQAKSHQLPFPKVISVSQAPLELVFSDVWGQLLVL